MKEPAILPVLPGTISAKDRAALEKVGVVVIEHPDPTAVRLIRAHAEISGTELMRCAARALLTGAGSSSDDQRLMFAKLVAEAVIKAGGQ